MGEKITVMVVDDDRNNRQILSKYLSREEMLVLTASNANEAFQILDVVVPDAIMMDYQMPKMNGLEAIKNIRELNKRTVIILMTAYSSQEVAIEAIRSKADDFLPKPLEFNTIAQKIKDHVKSRREMFPQNTRQEVPIKENLFTHFLLMKDSVPLYSLGRWQRHDKPENFDVITEHSNDDETLMSGFLSAIKSFSTSMFDQNLAEISMGNYQLLLRNSGNFMVCLTVSRESHRWLLSNGLLEIIENCLSEILNEVENHMGDSFGYKEGSSFIEGYITSMLERTAKRITTMG